MKAEIIKSLTNDFESSSYMFEGQECWDARVLQNLLGYSRWESFAQVIQRGKTACQTSGFVEDNHFRHMTKMVETGSGAQRSIEDVRLTRYACYLIAQNGDPAKEQIAFAMSYFALQTRKFEMLEERINQIERVQAREDLRETEKLFSGILYERGVDELGFAIIRNSGDEAFYGGSGTAKMKKKLGVKSGALADFLPTITMKAKGFATEITNFNIKKDEKLTGLRPIEREHVKNNQEVRQVLTKQGIFPENLPPEEDIKKVDRKIKSDSKRIAKEKKKIEKPQSE